MVLSEVIQLIVIKAELFMPCSMSRLIDTKPSASQKITANGVKNTYFGVGVVADRSWALLVNALQIV